MFSADLYINQCVEPSMQAEMAAIIRVESGGNSYAVALINSGKMRRQPQSLQQAKDTLALLDQNGIRYAAGIAQINRANFKAYGLHTDNVFEPCKNLQVGSAILKECYSRAALQYGEGLGAKRAAWSCYYSGNFQTGFERFGGRASYVERVAANLKPVSVNGSIPIGTADVFTTDAGASVIALPSFLASTRGGLVDKRLGGHEDVGESDSNVFAKR